MYFYKNKTQNHARFWVGLGIQVAKTACKTSCSSSANVTLFCRGRGKLTLNSLAIWPLSSKIIRSANCTASLTSCVTRMVVKPCSVQRRSIRFCISRRVRASKAPSGSSSSRIRADAIMPAPRRYVAVVLQKAVKATVQFFL